MLNTYTPVSNEVFQNAAFTLYNDVHTPCRTIIDAFKEILSLSLARAETFEMQWRKYPRTFRAPLESDLCCLSHSKMPPCHARALLAGFAAHCKAHSRSEAKRRVRLGERTGPQTHTPAACVWRISAYGKKGLLRRQLRRWSSVSATFRKQISVRNHVWVTLITLIRDLMRAKLRAYIRWLLVK